VIRLVALDVDGTLLDGRGRVPAANLEALHAAAARGIHLAVVTGRSQPFVLPAVRDLPDPLVLVVYNGAVARVRDGETIARRTIDPAVAQRVLAHTREWRDATTVQFDRLDAGQTLFDRMSWDHPNRRGYYAKVRQHVSQVDDLEAAMADADPVQVAFNGPTEAMRRLHARAAISRSWTSTPPVPPRATRWPPSPCTWASPATRSSRSATTTTTWTCCSGPAPAW